MIYIEIFEFDMLGILYVYISTFVFIDILLHQHIVQLHTLSTQTGQGRRSAFESNLKFQKCDQKSSLHMPKLRLTFIVVISLYEVRRHWHRGILHHAINDEAGRNGGSQ